MEPAYEVDRQALRVAEAFDHWSPELAADPFATYQQLPADDQVLRSLPSANRDEARFDHVDAIEPDRLPDPHVAFGGGIHRCLGAHIARSEMRVRLDEFLSAVPPFRLNDAAVTTWKSGPIRGPKAVTLAIDAPR